ncbi:hypothetical protein TPA0905_23030 [Streptomyces olivaceus]|nr:hypothetical protein TPA0905_23030 [Streptomyces olivaceus]
MLPDSVAEAKTLTATRPPPPSISATAPKVARRAPVGRLRLLCPKTCSCVVTDSDMECPRLHTRRRGGAFSRLGNSQDSLTSRAPAPRPPPRSPVALFGGRDRGTRKAVAGVDAP